MPKQAEEEFKKELVLNPSSDKTLFSLGLLYHTQGKLKQAEDSWLNAVKINPDNIDALKNLVIYYHEQKNTAKAKYYIIELQKRGIQIPPKYLEGYEK